MISCRYARLTGGLVPAMALVLLLGGVDPAGASNGHSFKVRGTGDNVEIDPTSLSPELRVGYKLMLEHCIDCHRQERMVTTLKTGRSPVTGFAYGKNEFRDKIIKIMRKPNSNLSPQDAKALTEFFDTLVDQTHQ